MYTNVTPDFKSNLAVCQSPPESSMLATQSFKSENQQNLDSMISTWDCHTHVQQERGLGFSAHWWVVIAIHWTRKSQSRT